MQTPAAAYYKWETKKHTHQTHQQQTPKSEVKMKIIWLNARNITIEWKKEMKK